MKFDEEIGQYIYEFNGLIFSWDEQPKENYKIQVNFLTENYYNHLDKIIQFMLPYIKKIYGDVSVSEVKLKLGKPVIDCDNGRVSYINQTFDETHIFTFEFLDDEFQEMQYFSIDG